MNSEIILSLSLNDIKLLAYYSIVSFPIVFFAGFKLAVFLHEKEKQNLITTKYFYCEVINPKVQHKITAQYIKQKLVFNSCPYAKNGICTKTNTPCDVVSVTPY